MTTHHDDQETVVAVTCPMCGHGYTMHDLVVEHHRRANRYMFSPVDAIASEVLRFGCGAFLGTSRRLAS